MFEVPVVLIIFRRKDTLERIIARIREVQPSKMYLLSDQGRDDEEKRIVQEVRECAEQLIDWPCTLAKYYADENRGVYANIGLGAKWVFEHESKAIFLEDDNLPEVTFFSYCKDLLDRYERDNRILWICGTNYLTEYRNSKNDSYMFTHNLLPCGWASWSEKFLSSYDFGFKSVSGKKDVKRIRKTYLSRALYKQEFKSIWDEYLRGIEKGKYRSWDYHMIYSLRKNNQFGISPATNQIKNIGVDDISEHGGNTFDNIMTKRFCGMDSKPLEIELQHPCDIRIDKKYERKIEHIITRPLKMRVFNRITDFLRVTLNIPADIRTKDYLLRRKRRK